MRDHIVFKIHWDHAPLIGRAPPCMPEWVDDTEATMRSYFQNAWGEQWVAAVFDGRDDGGESMTLRVTCSSLGWRTRETQIAVDAKIETIVDCLDIDFTLDPDELTWLSALVMGAAATR